MNPDITHAVALRERTMNSQLVVLKYGQSPTSPTRPELPRLPTDQIPKTIDGTTGYEVPNYRPPATVEEGQIPGAGGGVKRGTTQPRLQFMCGPMLKYDSIVYSERPIWIGYAMIVTSDNHSDYSRHPYLTLFDSQRPESAVDITGQKIKEFRSTSGSNSFWRFRMEIPLVQEERMWNYRINNGHRLTFWVPGANQNMRWVAHSCNGFSAGVDTASFNGSDPLWNDLLKRHQERPFHLLVGGGDQLYSDPVMREPELTGWLNEKDLAVKLKMIAGEEMAFAIDRYYFNHYCEWFRKGAFGKAISGIPMMNMADDHDIIDGFGSYPEDLMTSPVFARLGAKAFGWYHIFQNFQVPELDGSTFERPHTFKSALMGGESGYVPFRSYSWLAPLGPNVQLLMLDCRSERKKEKICSEETYDRVFNTLHQSLPPSTKHLVVQLGVPIAYPRMNFLESALENKYNPITMLAKTGTLGLGGFVNKFNKEAELLDDLNDHWTASNHKKERNWLIEQFQKVALERHVRVTFLSGDVHAAACGRFFSLKSLEPIHDPKYMLNIVSSAIVNTPPPPPVITMTNKLATKKHKTMHYCDTDETMEGLFEIDTDGNKLKNKYILGRRNYAVVDYLAPNTELQFTFQVEITKGGGDTKSYPISAPQPAW
ncbi:hypothetical protein BT69DRAFT_1256947 [Atractiella rhizophila]|nr:hypothetical protein BT69DRAFT_1256947 [Atractiella rhizophila]